jgi:hypothetical protein
MSIRRIGKSFRQGLCDSALERKRLGWAHTLRDSKHSVQFGGTGCRPSTAVAWAPAFGVSAAILRRSSSLNSATRGDCSLFVIF